MSKGSKGPSKTGQVNRSTDKASFVGNDSQRTRGSTLPPPSTSPKKGSPSPKKK